jgi:hypothetical protein
VATATARERKGHTNGHRFGWGSRSFFVSCPPLLSSPLLFAETPTPPSFPPTKSLGRSLAPFSPPVHLLLLPAVGVLHTAASSSAAPPPGPLLHSARWNKGCESSGGREKHHQQQSAMGAAENAVRFPSFLPSFFPSFLPFARSPERLPLFVTRRLRLAPSRRGFFFF